MKIDVDKLNIALAEKCMSISELAEKSGLNITTIYHFSERKTVRPVTVGKIAKVLNVKVEDLIK